MTSVFCCPVYDEIREFPEVLDAFRRGEHASDEVLLVDNGSTDGCERLIRESGLPFVRVAQNRGLGHACRLGLEWALERGHDVLGILAGNGKMLPSETGRLLAPILAGEQDCVTGSRFLPGGVAPNLPPFRRAAIPLVNLWARALTGRRITDATCGFRALRVEPFTRAEFDWRDPRLDAYGFEFYVYAKFLRDPTLRSCETPVTMRYPRRRRGYSKVPPITGWWSMLRPWWAARFDGKGFRAPGSR